jgi:hypothetical protein
VNQRWRKPTTSDQNPNGRHGRSHRIAEARASRLESGWTNLRANRSERISDQARHRHGAHRRSEWPTNRQHRYRATRHRYTDNHPDTDRHRASADHHRSSDPVSNPGHRHHRHHDRGERNHHYDGDKVHDHNQDHDRREPQGNNR